MNDKEKFWSDFDQVMDLPGMTPKRAASELKLSIAAVYSYQKRRATPAGEYRKRDMKAWMDKYARGER